MKQNEVLSLLHAEIVAEEERLVELATLLKSAPDDSQVFFACDAYAESLGRIGEAARNLGLDGLGASAKILIDGAMMAPVMEPESRMAFADALLAWPGSVARYLSVNPPQEALAVVAALNKSPEVYAGAEHTPESLRLALETLPDFAALFADEIPSRLSEATEEDVALSLPKDLDGRLYASFLEDAPDQAALLSGLVDKFAAGKATIEDMQAAKRVAHTFKGSANIIGIRGLANMAHHSEDILEFASGHMGETPPALSSCLVSAAGCMEAMVYSLLGLEPRPANARAVLQEVLKWANAIDRGEVADVSSVDPGAQQPALGKALSHDGEPTLPEAAVDPALRALEPDLQSPMPPSAAMQKESAQVAGAESAQAATVRVPVQYVEEILRLVGEKASMLAALRELQRRMETSADVMASALDLLAKRISELEMSIDVRKTEVSGGGFAKSSAFDSLEFDQYSELHTAARVLTEAAADARSASREVAQEIVQLDEMLDEGRRVQDELQRNSLGMRLTKVGSLAPRLHRAVRQAAQATGKQVTLLIEGESIEVDGEIVNQLADPLLHILRNAVDHGVETSDRRAASGKSEEGRITLAFSRAGPKLVVECHDDGVGIDFEAVRRRGESLGLLDTDRPVSEADLTRLILRSGFSTRSVVTDVSGRGVGLDVVRERVEKLGGSLEISSTRGSGTSLKLNMAASLAVQLALIVEVDGQQIALPAYSISTSQAAGQSEVRADAGKTVCVVGGRAIDARTARALLGYGIDFEATADWHARPMVFVASEGTTTAISVDRIIEVQELFVRQPGNYLNQTPGFMGASLLADGSVVPLVDLAALLRNASMPVRQRSPEVLEMPSRGRILAVDDSLSVREMLKELLSDAGFEAATAIDGMAAIRTMEKFKPDLVITDLEMPNLNGIELAANIRRESGTKHLPIIMITSRSQDKHRALAEEVGVSLYLTKPYSEDRLLSEIDSLLGAAQLSRREAELDNG